MLTLNEQQLNDLKAFINKIPTEFGLPLLTFFGQLEQEQKPKQESKQEVIDTFNNPNDPNAGLG
jgi:hypothetical protein